MKPYRQFTAESNQLNHFTEAAKERLFTGPGKSDPKRLIGVYTKSGKWIKDMKSEREARKYVDATYESVQMQEAPASGVEGDYEGEMARSELKSLIANSRALLGMIGQDSEIQAWQQSKITKAADYISSVHNDMVADTVQEAKGIPNPNTVPGQNPKPVQGDHRIAPKPMTMAQRHTEIQRSGKGIVKFMRTIVADWKSGNMALSRMESVMFNLGWLRGATLGYDPASDRDYKAVATAFRKKHPEADRILRLGKGGGFNPSMGKVTPNEITRTFEAILAFIETDIPAMKKAGTISASWDPMGTAWDAQ